MSRIPVTNSAGEARGEVEIADALLVRTRGQQALKDVLVAHRAALRAGTASTRTKGEVAGSNRKPWSQKGLGRARAGYRRSPLWRGGGVVFGPKPRDYRKAVSRKLGRLAFARALSDKVDAQALRVLDTLSLSAPKTKELAALLKGLGIRRPVLVILDRPDAAVQRAARNLPRVVVAAARDVQTYDVVRYPTVLAVQAAIPVLEARLKLAAGK